MTMLVRWFQRSFAQNVDGVLVKNHTRFLGSLFIVLATVACGNNPVAPDPSPTPSPSASPTPIAIDECKVKRVDIFAQRTDGKAAGDIVVAWPTGVVPILEAVMKLAGDFANPAIPTGNCPSVDKITWGQDPSSQARCLFLGNATAAARPFQCFTPGNVTVYAQPQGVDIEPGIATFRIQPGAEFRAMSAAEALLWVEQTAAGAELARRVIRR